MKNFNERIETLRREITESIRSELMKRGLWELTLPHTVNDDHPPVFVICFDNNGAPYECIVHKIRLQDDGLAIEAADKNTGLLFETSDDHELATRTLVWLNEIYETVAWLLENNQKNV